MKIKILSNNEELYIECCKRQNLLTVLLKNNVFFSNVCHGNGTCGKCKIKVISGYLPITEADKRSLSEDELKQGIRLACKAEVGKKTREQNEQEIRESCVERENETEQEELCIEVIGKSEENIIVEGVGKINNKVETEKENNDIKTDNHFVRNEDVKSRSCFIAVDIGTTTIAMALVDEETGEIIDTYTSLNHQRKYGADVISRIKAANDGKAEELKQLIEDDLWRGISRLITSEYKTEGKKEEKTNIEKENGMGNRNIELSNVIVAGNTTMIHLLMGYSCLSLGKHPFHSEYLEKIECKLEKCFTLCMKQNVLEKEIAVKSDNLEKNHFTYDEKRMWNEYKKIPVTILPGISAFVGGDIVAGILICPGFETEENCLLVDLGTNGEIVLGNRNKILVTSTAAGPAFEGGNITNGTACIPGSIDKVKIQNQKAVVKTIKGEMPPIGICGTGLVSVMVQLKRSKLMNSNGNLKYPYSEKGFPLWSQSNAEKIAIYQKDIREFQMAKSAIRTGIEILMEEYGCQVNEIKYVYLAGGFGTNLSEDDVLDTGIFPEEWKGRIVPIGNGALQGAIRFGKITSLRKKGRGDWNQNEEEIVKINRNMWREQYGNVDNIRKRAKTISLVEHKKFQEKYLEYMNF